MKQPVDRVLDELGMPKLVAALEGLGGADLTSLLLDVLRHRVEDALIAARSLTDLSGGSAAGIKHAVRSAPAILKR